MTFWGQNREHCVPSGCSCAVPLETPDAVPTAPSGWPQPSPGFKCHLQSHACSLQHTAAAQRGNGAQPGFWSPLGSLHRPTKAQAWEPASCACGWLAKSEATCSCCGPPFRNHSSGCSGWGQLGPSLPGTQPTHIWSQGSRCSGASRSGLGSLTKISPLQVMDQMACEEGRPWTLWLSQQDRLSRASWHGEMAGHHWERGQQQAEAGLPRVCCPLTPAAGITAHSPSRSYPARWRQPDAPATSAGSCRGCTGRRRAWSR